MLGLGALQQAALLERNRGTGRVGLFQDGGWPWAVDASPQWDFGPTTSLCALTAWLGFVSHFDIPCAFVVEPAVLQYRRFTLICRLLSCPQRQTSTVGVRVAELMCDCCQCRPAGPLCVRRPWLLCGSWLGSGRMPSLAGSWRACPALVCLCVHCPPRLQLRENELCFQELCLKKSVAIQASAFPSSLLLPSGKTCAALTAPPPCRPPPGWKCNSRGPRHLPSPPATPPLLSAHSQCGRAPQRSCSPEACRGGRWALRDRV